METGIYKEVQQMLENAAVEAFEAKGKKGNKYDRGYKNSRLVTLDEVRSLLSKHGLRYDEHGVSGRRDGEVVPEHGEFSCGNKRDSIPVATRLAHIERAITHLQSDVKTLSDLQDKPIID